MKIINKVTIKYFRSLHTVEIKQCEDLCIFTGRNDVGKSNVLKALNLFFNKSTDWESDFEFYDNFSKKRLEEVRRVSVKGKQFISVKIEFKRPNNYKNSLPLKFTVERRWSRDSNEFTQSDNLSALSNQEKLPSTLTTAQKSLAKFLNRVHFEYVPAIKDRYYVSNLLARLQKDILRTSIDSNADLLGTANSLAEHIEDQILDLKSDFESATNIATSIKPPSSISSLFQSFLVSTSTSDGDVPLMFRGDGLQARYIASVLHYIAQNSNDFYIWGYEEPEIALEYSHANQLARDFRDTYSDVAQVFLTSHSPAFISLNTDTVSCFRVSQENGSSIVANIDIKSDVDRTNRLKEELGILDIQKEVHDFYQTKLQELESTSEKVRELEQEINNAQSPMILTEGVTDRLILDHVRNSLNDFPDVVIRECNNSGGSEDLGGASTLSNMIKAVHPEDGRLVIAVFDNDHEGQKEFSRLGNNFRAVEGFNYLKKHRNNLAWALLLPEPDFREGFAERQCLTIELLFSDDVLNLEHNGRTPIRITEYQASVSSGPTKIENLPEELINSFREHGLLSYKIEGDKRGFAENIVPQLQEDDLNGFAGLVDALNYILEQED